MTPESQRIAIAETCGWKHEPDKYYELGLAWFDPITNQRYSTCDLPDYLNDLNAMHEAEKGLEYKDLWEYHHRLNELKGFGGNNHWKTFHATAAQRAEAFLRTLGLWKE